MYKNKVLYSLAIFFTLFGAAEGESIETRILQETKASTIIEFKLSDYQIEDIKINEATYSKVTVPQAPIYLEKGYPELPKFARSIIVPDDGIMKFRIVDMEYKTVQVNPIIPSKGNLKRNINPDTVPYTWDEFYNKDEWFPAEIVEISEPYLLREFRGVTVRFNPFQYNPQQDELKVVTRVVVEVYVIGNGGKNVFVRNRQTIDKTFCEIYRNHFLNFKEAWGAIYPFLDETVGNMLIIAADAYYDNMSDFVYWKRKKGIPVEICSVSNIGNTSTDIKDYIQNKYNTEGVTWVLLVGNESDVRTIAGTYDETCDPVYAYLAGSDNYLDAFISRFSANNETHVDNQVARSVKYERYPQDGASWYHRACGTASNEGNPDDCERLSWVNDTLLAYTYTSADQLCEPSAQNADVLGAINEGKSILNHIGHGGTTGFGTNTAFWIGISEIAALSNTDMLPFAFLVACLTGDFDAVTTCCCEQWLWAGTPNAPTGAIAVYGASVNQSWEPPTYAQLHANGLLKREEAVTIGGIAFNGAMYMLDVSGDLEMLETWHIFGDASLDLRTDTPGTFNVTHSPTIPVGSSSFTVTVQDNDGVTLLQDALVCCWCKSDTTMWVSGYTDASGQVSLSINPSQPGDTMWVTATKHNYHPYEGCALSISSGAYVAYLKHSIDDDDIGPSSGNGDGVVDAGETIELPLWVKNYGTETAYDVTGKLTTTDAYVAIVDSLETFGTITPGDSVATSSYVFEVNSSTPNEHYVNFDLTCQDNLDSTWVSNFSIVVQNVPDIEVNPDSLGVILAPGDTTSQIMRIRNVGIDTLSFSIIESSVPVTSKGNKLNPVFGEEIPLVENNPNQTRMLTVPNFLPLEIKSYTERTAKVLESTISKQSTPFADIIFFDDMESGTGSWTTADYSGGGDLWHQITSHLSVSPAYHSATHSWWCGIDGSGTYYNGNTITNALISPNINLTGNYDSVTFSFWEYYETEPPDWDLVNVDISPDGGTTWNPLRSGVTGSSGGWQERSFDISTYVGNNIKIRFYFDTQDAIENNYYGWFIDDVLITGKTLDVDWLFEDPVSGTVPPGDSTDIEVFYDASGLNRDTTHKAWLKINSNDPDESTVSIPVTLTVLDITPGDVGPVAIISLPGTVFVDSTYSPQARITNFGSDTVEPFNVTCIIDTLETKGYSDTKSVSNLGGGDTVLVTFTDWTVPLARKDYKITVFTQLSSDTDPSNDTLDTFSYEYNDAPVVSNLPDTSFWEDDSLKINLDNYVADSDDPDSTLTWSCLILGAKNSNQECRGRIHTTRLAPLITNYSALPAGRQLPITGSKVSPIYVDINPSTHIATITADPDWNGSRNIIFTAEDPWGLSGADTMSVTVDSVNDAPVVFIPDTSFPEDDTLMLDLDDYVSDVDNPDSVLSWSYSGNDTIIVALDSATHLAAFSAPDDWYGSEVIVFTVDDNVLKATTVDSVTITVNPVNDAPVIDSISPESPCTTITDSAIIFSVYAHDVDSDTLTYDWLINGVRDTTTSEPAYLYSSPEETIDTVEVIVSDASLQDSTQWVIVVKVGVAEDIDALPKVFSLSQNSPNPFATVTSVKWSVPKPCHTNLKIFDITGSLVKILFADKQEPGYYSTEWDASDYPSGIYFVKLSARRGGQAGDYKQTKKLILMR